MEQTSSSGAEHWLARAQQGDREALDALVRSYRPSIYRYCRARLGSHELADDVTQEVCMALVQALPRHRASEHSLSAYVFGIAANQVAMAHRSQYRRRDEPTATLPEVVEPGPGPEELAQAGSAAESVRQLLDYLPDNDRQILLLRLAAGLSSRDTGEVLGMSAGAVRVAQHRALTALRRLIDETQVLR